MNPVEELIKLLENENCDYDRCRQLIKEIGGCTKIIKVRYEMETTALHEVISMGHYDFALELIADPGADLGVRTEDESPIIWDLQYLWEEKLEDQWIESEKKLAIMRALIRSGANPNPKADNGEELLYWIRYKEGEREGTEAERYHLWEIEHIIDAHANGATERFWDKLKNKAVHSILLPSWGFYLMDDDLCDCDHAIFVFEDGERMALSSYQVGEDEGDFYAVPLQKGQTLDHDEHRIILPREGEIRFLKRYNDEFSPSSHWLDLTIDDALLRFHADSPGIMVGVVNREDEVQKEYEQRVRKCLFLD